MSSAISAKKSKIGQYKSEIASNSTTISRLRGISQDISIIDYRNKEIIRQIEEIKNETDSTDELISESTKKIAELQDKIKEIYKELDILEQAKAIVSEEGVKTVIIKNILTFLNGRLNYYLSVLEAPVKCSFDDSFESNLTYHNGKECEYFTFRDLLSMQTGINFNIFMIDELFDGAVDQKGLEKIMEILKDRIIKYKEATYIVSHNPNTQKFDIDNTVMLVKKDGFTRLLLENGLGDSK